MGHTQRDELGDHSRVVIWTERQAAVRCRLAQAYAKAVMRERIAWAMLLATDRADPTFERVADEWGKAATLLAAGATALATASAHPRSITPRKARERVPGRIALKSRST